MDSGADDLLELMDRVGIPRTREDYIAVAWGDDPPVPWTAELESELPDDLQDWSLFDVVDGRLQKKGVDSVYLDHWMRREFNPDEPRDEDGKWTDGGGSDGGGDSGGGVEFVSPSVENNLDLKQAVSALGGAQQASLRQASDYIDQELKLAGRAANAVGAWSDGAENTVVDFHGSSKWTDWDRIALAASMKGHIADQKSVLAFQEQQNRQPRESRSIALSSKTKLTVEINPTTSDIRSMAKEAPVRVLIDSDGNMYAWDANEAIHSQVSGAMGLDEKHQDIWYMSKGKLVSDRYLPEGGPQDGGNNVTEARREAAIEVRDTMASLNGNAILLSFPAKGDLAAIHQSLLSDGLPFHTLIPGKGGATVYVAATDPKEMTATVDAAKKAAERYDSQITVRRGRGEFIGDFSGSGSDREQRDRARQAYEQVIQRSSVHDSEAVWSRVRDKWGQAAAKAYLLAREFNPDEPRDEQGRWTDGGGSDGGGESDSSGGGSARPPAPAGEIQNNKIPHNLTADEKVARLVALTAENKPILDAAIAKIDAKYGTESSSDIKKPDRIAAKASRPSVLAAKPWFDVEYIRDSLRFKSVVDTFANTKAIVKELEDSGDFKVIKYDVGKVTNPKEWGWRMLPIDLQMKNGQIVEYYMVSKDQAAVAHEGHTIFEKWRNLDAAKFTPAQVKEYQADLAASQKLNGDAWQAYKDRTGQTESDFLASVTRDPTSSKSSIK